MEIYLCAVEIAAALSLYWLYRGHHSEGRIWLEAMLNSPYCYQQSQRFTRGIANHDLGLTRMVKIQIYLPPLSLQREFARRVRSVQKLKTAQRASLAELDALFASLQHRAFRGEL